MESVTKSAKNTKQEVKNQALKKMREKWEEKPLPQQYLHKIKKLDVELGQPHQWLRNLRLKAKTEGVLIAAQD